MPFPLPTVEHGSHEQNFLQCNGSLAENVSPLPTPQAVELGTGIQTISSDEEERSEESALGEVDDYLHMGEKQRLDRRMNALPEAIEHDPHDELVFFCGGSLIENAFPSPIDPIT